MRFFRNLCVLSSTVLITTTAWTQATTSLLSDEAGTYQFVQVPPGAYILVADALIRLNGKFERVSLRDVTLVPRTSVNPQRTTDIKPTITK